MKEGTRIKASPLLHGNLGQSTYLRLYAAVQLELMLGWLFNIVLSLSILQISRESNPSVLAGSLPFLGIIFVLPFSLQNLPFFVFIKKSKFALYLISKLSKNFNFI